jgi:hypothetical protein
MDDECLVTSINAPHQLNGIDFLFSFTLRLVFSSSSASLPLLSSACMCMCVCEDVCESSGVGSKLNHGRPANATFMKVVFGGQKRVLVVSIEWIFADAEITVDYGNDVSF